LNKESKTAVEISANSSVPPKKIKRFIARHYIASLRNTRAIDFVLGEAGDSDALTARPNKCDKRPIADGILLICSRRRHHVMATSRDPVSDSGCCLFADAGIPSSAPCDPVV
jgi:hypothetical protein